MLYAVTHKRFHLFYCIAGVYSYCVTFCALLVAFVCQEIKGLLTYLLTYLHCTTYVTEDSVISKYWSSLTKIFFYFHHHHHHLI